MLEVWNDIDTESESEVGNEECEDDLVVQECISSSSEEEDVTLDSSVAGPNGPSRTACSRRNPVVYEWMEISDSKEKGTTAFVMHVLWLYFVQRNVCINAKMKCMHVSLLYQWSMV